MNWYHGNIPDAIKLTKEKKCPIVVYITGKEEYNPGDDLWQDEDVLEIFKQETCVALKLNSGSVACQQFSDIYPVVIVPCTYVIADNGKPIDMLPSILRKDEFIEKVTDAFTKYKEMQKSIQSNTLKSCPVSSATAAANPDVAHHIDNELGAATGDAAECTDKDEISDWIDAGMDMATAGDDIRNSSNQFEDVYLSSEEKVQRAQDLIAERNEKKSQDEKVKDRLKEVERRKLGQSSSKFKRWQDDKDTEEQKKTWKKDKEADRLARERVREQIALDRAEKNEAYQTSKENKLQEIKKSRLDKDEKSAQDEIDRLKALREHARIQFRLPDGSSVCHTFSATDTLQSVVQFISRHIDCRESQVTLSTIFPRRSFTRDHYDVTLDELELTPSAVIMAIPSPLSLVAVSSPLYALASLIVKPAYFIWGLFYGLFFGFSSTSSTSSSKPSTDPNQPSTTSVSSESSITRERPRTAYTRRAMPPSSASRLEGNIHRFSNKDDEDDENATWNGNSTQQM